MSSVVTSKGALLEDNLLLSLYAVVVLVSDAVVLAPFDFVGSAFLELFVNTSVGVSFLANQFLDGFGVSYNFVDDNVLAIKSWVDFTLLCANLSETSLEVSTFSGG